MAIFNFVLIAAALILSISEFKAGNSKPLIGISILVLFWTYTIIWESRIPYIVLGTDFIKINNFFFVPSKKFMFDNIDKIENQLNMRFLIRLKNNKIYLIDLKKMDKKQREDFVSAMSLLNI